MKKNGFTLVELLAVISVLIIVMTLVSISAINIMYDSKDDIGKFTKEQIKDAATAYALDNSILFNEATSWNFAGKDAILEALGEYYPEMEDKCNFEENAEIIILEEESNSSNIGGIDVSIEGIECTR